jgi:hypothetical protein
MPGSGIRQDAGRTTAAGAARVDVLPVAGVYHQPAVVIVVRQVDAVVFEKIDEDARSERGQVARDDQV